MRRRGGWCETQKRLIVCVVTGEMADGRKVWTECDKEKNPINLDKQYFMETRGNWTEFIEL